MAVKKCTQLDRTKVSQYICDISVIVHRKSISCSRMNFFFFCGIQSTLAFTSWLLFESWPPIISNHHPSQLRKTEYEGIESEKVVEIVVSYLI